MRGKGVNVSAKWHAISAVNGTLPLSGNTCSPYIGGMELSARVGSQSRCKRPAKADVGEQHRMRRAADPVKFSSCLVPTAKAVASQRYTCLLNGLHQVSAFGGNTRGKCLDVRFRPGPRDGKGARTGKNSNRFTGRSLTSAVNVADARNRESRSAKSSEILRRNLCLDLFGRVVQIRSASSDRAVQ